MLKSYKKNQVSKHAKADEVTPELKALAKYPHAEGYYVSRAGKAYKMVSGNLVSLKGSVQSSGHVSISLGRGKREFLHRMVMLSWDAGEGYSNAVAVVRHLDGNPGNNSLDNLVWGSHKENASDTAKHAANRQLSAITNAAIHKAVTLISSGANAKDVSAKCHIPESVANIIQRTVEILRA